MSDGSRPSYASVLRHDSMPSFVAAGALQFAGPATALVVLIFSIPHAYSQAGHTNDGAIALALLGLSSAIPTVAAAFFAGPLADRHDRHLLLRSSNLTSLLGVAGLGLVVFARPGGAVSLPLGSHFYLPLWVALAYPAWATVIASATVFRPAYNASVPRLVPTTELGRANGLVYSVAAAASAVSSLGAGIVLSTEPTVYGLGVPFLLFLATQVALVGVRADLSAPRPRPVRRIRQDAVEGFRYLVRRRDLFELTIAALVLNFLIAIAFVELGLYVLVDLRLTTGFWYGAMVAASSAGAGVGMVTIAQVRFEERAGRMVIGLVLAMGLAIVALGAVHSVWLALPIVFAYGLLPGMVQTIFLSTVQATVPNDILGRVFSADEIGSYALVPIGQATGGAITYEVGVEGTYLATGGAIVGLAAVMAVGFGSLRALGFRPYDARSSAASAGD